MSLNAKFSITPREWRKYLFDSSTGIYEYYANQLFYGVYMGSEEYSLEKFYNDNKVYLACNNVDYPFPDPYPPDYFEHAHAHLAFMTDAPTDKRYLMLFHMHTYDKIGVYLNGNLVREEDCNGDETIAVLFDCPGPNIWDTMYVVPQTTAWIKGIDCYVL